VFERHFEVVPVLRPAELPLGPSLLPVPPVLDLSVLPSDFFAFFDL
jgi:hypothetical protein